MADASEKVEVENINTPGRVERVDKGKYLAMREALLKVLPETTPGLTAAEAKAALLEFLPQTPFPNGEKAGWWMKSVQLDLEAKKIIEREPTKPLRFHRIK